MSYPYRNPRLQTDVAQPDPDSRLLLNHETGRYVRLGLREFDWLNRLDGQLHARDVAAALGQEEALAQEMLRRMAAAKLICFSDEPVQLQAVEPAGRAEVETRRVEWAQFGQLRIHAGRPGVLLDRMAPFTRLLMSRAAVAAGIFFSFAGLALALAQSGDFVRGVRDFQWTGWQVATMMLLMFGTTAVHELGHAVACHYFGAPVRSLGVMIYYLQPAAYADITDSWQLKNRWQRVAISSAGVYVQAIISTVVIAVWSVLRLTGHRNDLLVMFVALNATIIIFNVIPFVKFDGYWILTNILGISNLRDRAVEWVRTTLASRLTRRPIDPRALRFNAVLSMTPLGRALLTCFGVSALTFGTAMWFGGLGFLFRVARWSRLSGVASFIAVGGVLALFAALYVVRMLLARRRSAPAAAAQPRTGAIAQTPQLSAVVTHAIDGQRPVRLNPYVSAVDGGNGEITFAWSTPDALTVQASAAFFEAIPRLREGFTIDELKKSDLWSANVERALQRLWHEKHLRYASDWEIADEDVRYGRQFGWLSMNAKVRGKEAEVLARLRSASVAILGVGGLGTHVAWNLAACGVGELHLVDGDIIELTNLNRQLFYTPADIGRRKVDVAAERIAQFNPETRVRTTHKYLVSLEDFYEIIKGSTFVVRAVDTPRESLAWVNEACVRSGIPYSGAGFFPQGTICGPTVLPSQSSCLACNAPAVAPRFDRGTGGTLAPLVFTTAGVLASEVITYLGGLGEVRSVGRMLAINAPSLNFTYQDVPRNANCPVCGPGNERMTA
jgi:molybdopterin/thiamine biosynthesis adenylyltransferase/Zn-dependent protease